MIMTRDRNKTFANQRRSKDGGHWTTVNTVTDIWKTLDLSIRKSKNLSAFRISLSQAKF